MTALRLGTRRSALAWAQAGQVADALRAAGFDVEMVPVVTEGDTATAPMTSLGGTGVFATALREKLRSREIDIAVHSYKDLPTRGGAEGLVIAAVPPRADPRDVLCAGGGRTLAELPDAARIGTGSPRRAAQLAALGRGFVPVPIRGNVDTRLGKIGDGLDAVVLAAAGLDRLGRTDAITEYIAPALVMPAPAQGALAIECRHGTELADALQRAADHPPSRARVDAERALLARLEAGCLAPVGALATATGDSLHLDAVVVAGDGSRLLRRADRAPFAQAADLGTRVADALLTAGAADLLAG